MTERLNSTKLSQITLSSASTRQKEPGLKSGNVYISPSDPVVRGQAGLLREGVSCKSSSSTTNFKM